MTISTAERTRLVFVAFHHAREDELGKIICRTSPSNPKMTAVRMSFAIDSKERRIDWLCALGVSSRFWFIDVSVLNDALKSMYNAEKRRKRQIMIRPSSKVIIKFLIVMQKHGYIGEFEYVEDHRSGKIVVELNGR
ncbi:hypothetical protein QQ045_005004 [Rhodiola kirilowii]